MSKMVWKVRHTYLTTDGFPVKILWKSKDPACVYPIVGIVHCQNRIWIGRNWNLDGKCQGQRSGTSKKNSGMNLSMTELSKVF